MTPWWLRVSTAASTGVSGYITVDEIARRQLVGDEVDDRLAHRHAALAHDVIVVQEEREDARVLVGGGGLFVVARADGALRVARLRGRVDLDQPERLGLLRLAVFLDLEILELEVGDGIALPVGDDDVDADGVDAGAEDRLLGRRGRLSGLLRGGAGAGCSCCRGSLGE